VSKIYKYDEVEASTLEYFDGDELAANVFPTKYALRNKGGEFLELNPDHMHDRLSDEFFRIEKKYPSPTPRARIRYKFDKFRYIVAQGSPMFGVGNDYVNCSLSNCLVVGSPEDNITSIVEKGKELANLSKNRCGVGIDISTLRPEGMPVNNAAGTTSGAWSFADFYSYVIRMIGQNGRRGALMITMDVRHPDVRKFAGCKSDKTKVTGANISIKLTDDFMNAVANDEDFELRWPVDSESPKYTRVERARDIWNEIVNYATHDAEPGLMMWDNILKTLPAECYADMGFKHVTTNPCGELPLSAGDSCRLISINLKHYVQDFFTDSAYFDFDEFAKDVRLAMRMSDNLVDLEIEKIEKIIKTCDTEDEIELWRKILKAAKDGRRTGLGTHGLADALARLCIRYDSKESLEMLDNIYRTFRDEAYRASVELAKERGAFPVFDWGKEKDNEFIKRLPQDLQDDIAKYGRRNISLLTMAPTGSVSIMSQVSSGIEPVFKNGYTRRRKISHNDLDTQADFVDDLGDRWQEFQIYHHNAKEYLNMFPGELPDFFVESGEIDWQARVDLQGVIQYYIDHSISSTINLPKGTTEETVSEIYLRAWKKGLKGVTVYVDGSRSGVLVSNDEANTGTVGLDYLTALKQLECISDDAQVTEEGVIVNGVRIPDSFVNGASETIRREGNKYYLNFSYLPNCGDHPIALWIYSNNLQDGEYVSLNRGVKKLRDLLVSKGVDQELVNVQYSKLKPKAYHENIGKMAAMCLRHNIQIPDIINALEGIEGDYISSTLTAVRKFLARAVPDGVEKVGAKCTACGSSNIIFESGCDKCLDCGNSGCS